MRYIQDVVGMASGTDRFQVFAGMRGDQIHAF